MKHYVSIVAPAYNEGENIRACVNSLKAQDFPKEDFEIILVDNNSPDNTLEIIKSLDVIYTVEHKRGRSEARNAGIRMAKGDIIALIDSDCVAGNNWLNHIVSAFADPAVGCVAGEIVPVENRKASTLERYLIKIDHLSQKEHIEHSFLPYAATANAAYRKEVFDNVGLFAENMSSEEDADLSWRMQLFTDYKVAYVPEALVFHRHESSLKELFRQKRRHAYSSVNLYKIYKEYGHSEVKCLRKIYWQYLSIFRRWVKLILYRRHNKLGPSPVNEYQLILETAEKLGLIQGSLRHKVWYV
jgi:cellulose synthase/poly-beta-1,6-N-acetylglucosamine synthase-like glycosyltransferase